MNCPFQLQIDFTNDCNWIYAFIVKLEIRRHIGLHRINSKNPNNLHKNGLFFKRYITSNDIVMENYKWLFKKQFMFFFKYRYLPYAWKDTKDLRSELPFWTYLFMDSSWDFCLLCLGVENDLLQLLYLPIKAFETTILKYSNDMSSPRFIFKNSTVYICDFHEIKKHAQVKAMLAFTIENLWAASFLSIISTPSMSLMYNLMILGQKTKIPFEFFHIFINTYRLKWFC